MSKEKFRLYQKITLVRAIRITSKNRQEIESVDGDGCLLFAEDGEWFVVEQSGIQIYDNDFFRANFKRTR